jgi:hypothetical protein
MYEAKFVSRLQSLGWRNIVLSFDTFAGVIAFSATYVLFDGAVPASEANTLLSVFTTASASLFAIVLTGLTIITSFTDKLFLYAWKEVGEFDNIITLFQFNLFLPMFVILASLLLLVSYSSIAMIFLISFFVYMLFLY